MPEQAAEFRIEPRLDRRNADVLAVLAAVHVIERRPTVEDVGTPRPHEPRGVHAEGRGGQRCGAIDDGGVDHLAAPGSTALQDGGEHAERKIEPATAKVAEQVERRHRPLVRPADPGEDARHRDVVEVVAGCLGQGAVLPPSRHAPIYQPRIAGQAWIGPQPEALGDARPEALDEPIGPFHELQDERPAGLAFEVDRQVLPIAQQQVELQGTLDAELGRDGPIDADHGCAEVG